MADGYEVDPEALRALSGTFHAGAGAVARAGAHLSVAQLTPAALGEVEAAYELSSAFADFVGRCEDDLRRGSAWVTDTANGLVASADEYLRREDLCAELAERTVNTHGGAEPVEGAGVAEPAEP